MTTYIVAIRREARLEAMTAEERVRQIPGVRVMGAGNPSRVPDAHAPVAEETGACSERAPDRQAAVI